MEANSEHWNAMEQDEKAVGKRRRDSSGDEERYMFKEEEYEAPTKAIKRFEVPNQLNGMPPSLIDTMSMLKDDHPAINAFAKKELQQQSFSGAVWTEKDVIDYELRQLGRLQGQADDEEDRKNFEELKQGFINNRKQYEEIRDRAIAELQLESASYSK